MILAGFGILAFMTQQRSSSRRGGNVESRVLCGFPSSEGGDQNAVPRISTRPPTSFPQRTVRISGIFRGFGLLKRVQNRNVDVLESHAE